MMAMHASESVAPPADADELTNILIVDDEPANLLVLETVLADPGYRLVRAMSADQALLALMAQEFAVMVLDIQLPDMNGIELAQLIKERKRNAHLPIIFLTAYFDQDQDRLQGYGSGAVDYLHKPVNPAVLRSKVAVFAELDRKTRALQRANGALRELNETLERRVTERSEALLAADRRLQAMMSSITDGLLLIEHGGRIGYVNEQGARLLGRGAAELTGLHRRDAFGNDEFAAGLDQALLGDRTASFEARVGDGARWLQCHCYPSPDGLSVYFHDITDRRELQLRGEQLLAAEQAARSAADHAARAKEELLAAISHELRTPLAAIVGWVNVLTRPGVQPAMLERGLQAIARNAQAQSVLVDDLLEMSRIVAGKQLMNVQRVDLNALASAAVDTARPTAQGRDLTLALHLAPGPAEVFGDAGRLTQVIMNLVTNAMKFTRAGGRVTLQTCVDAAAVELHVSDNGQGIAPDFLPHLFDRFSQADDVASSVHGGLGLGLSIVKNLVELHGGEVWARSPGPDQGAVFSVRLPRAGRSQPAVAAVADAEPDDGLPEAELGGLRVLLVDDHADVLEAHARLLAGRGAEVATAGSGEDALALLQGRSFDVLLSDLGMPGMGGYELMREVRGRLGLGPDRLGAAAVTAYVRDTDREAALAAGFQRCLHKTTPPRLLARVVAELAPPRLPVPGADPAAPLRTLFVEDNPDLREQIAWLLEELGLELQSCATAEEALPAYTASHFDLLITDVSLPGMSGVDLARAVLERRPDAWVVFSSGYAMGADLAGFGPNVRALLKPFELGDVERLVDEVRLARARG
jgi:signal transduction histidine kinase